MQAGKKNPGVLVTGGAGLVGSRLVRALLNEGLKVRVLDTRYGELDSAKTAPNLEFAGVGSDGLKGGMANKATVEEAVKGVDVIYHLAINWDGASWKHALPLADLFDANIRGTLNLLQSAKSNKVRHFLFSSSAAVYGETEWTLKSGFHAKPARTADEETVCRPEFWNSDPSRPAYAILKLATERLCLMYHHSFGLPVTVFRLEYVFVGERELSDGANIHVDDVVRAFLLATLNKKAYGQVFNIAHRARYLSSTKAQEMLGWSPTKTREFLRKRIHARALTK